MASALARAQHAQRLSLLDCKRLDTLGDKLDGAGLFLWNAGAKCNAVRAARAKHAARRSFDAEFTGFSVDRLEDESLAAVWAQVFEGAPGADGDTSEAPIDYAVETGFSRFGKYSGMGVVLDDDLDSFEPEPPSPAGGQSDPEGDSDEGEAADAVPASGPGEPGADDSDGDSAGRIDVATFRELYTSRDGALTLFESEDGHLMAVDSSKLA